MLDPRCADFSYFSIPGFAVLYARGRMGHVGHTYVEPNDAIVFYIISLCFAMYHMDAIDVIVSRMTARESMSFSLMC